MLSREDFFIARFGGNLQHEKKTVDTAYKKYTDSMTQRQHRITEKQDKKASMAKKAEVKEVNHG